MVYYGKKYEIFNNKTDRVIEVSCGSDHVAAIVSGWNNPNNSGQWYTWGLKSFGRLGNISKQDLKNSVTEYSLPKVVKIKEEITRVACGDDFTACLTNRGKWYTWGLNKNGYLGSEDVTFNKEEIPIIATPRLVAAWSAKIITQIACGSKHMMCWTNEHLVYSWGNGDYGVLGLGDESGINKPQIIKGWTDKEVIFIAAGAFTSGAITGDGKLFLWGRGKYGVLGHGNEDNYFSPKLVSNGIDDEMIFFVSLGFYHTIALSINCKTFSWGYSENGRWGSWDKSDCDKRKRILYPREIPSLRGWTVGQVVAGNFHSIIIESNVGKIMGWGNNLDYVLGKFISVEESADNKAKRNHILYNPTELIVNKVIQKITGGISDWYEAYFNSVNNVWFNMTITDNRQIKKIACGASHTWCWSKNGLVFSWGFGPWGQLGLGYNANLPKQWCNDYYKIIANIIKDKREYDKILNVSATPSQVTFPDDDIKIVKIYAGFNNSMAISSNHLVFMWGDNRYGQLCRKSFQSEKDTFSCTPIIVEAFYGKEMIKGALGYNNCAWISNEYKLYIWGANENMKLGVNSPKLFEPHAQCLESISNITKISLGLHHSAAINIKNELFTWGHGFYGQWGNGLRASKSTPMKVDKIITKYTKVKCGTYQTWAIDQKNIIYTFGKGGITWNIGDDHKLFPESITEFKSEIITNIQVANGTSYAWNKMKELYSWGDNSRYKVCCLKDEVITSHSMPIKFNFSTKCNIKKLFAGFSHCFILNEWGEVYGWGNSDCYRLTSKYGDEQKDTPVKINWFENIQKDNYHLIIDNILNEAPAQKGIDERLLRRRWKMKNSVITFGEICYWYENINDKYTDKSLIENDIEINSKLKDILTSLPKWTENRLPDKKYVYINKLLNYRFKESKSRWQGYKTQENLVKKGMNMQDWNDIITSNMFEIESLYTWFYIHPCMIIDYFEDKDKGVTLNNFSFFIRGISPVFMDYSLPSQRCMNYDSIILIMIYKILLKKEIQRIEQYSDNDTSIYPWNESTWNETNFIEYLLRMLLYNKYKKNNWIDVWGDSLRWLIKECMIIINSKMNSINITKFIQKYQNLNTLITLDKDIGVQLVFKVIDSFIRTIEQNKEMFSDILFICTKIFKNKLKKMFKTKGMSKEWYSVKIVNIITRFFFKNIIAKELSIILEQDYCKKEFELLLNEYLFTKKEYNEYWEYDNYAIYPEEMTKCKEMIKYIIDLMSVIIQYISTNTNITGIIDEENINWNTDEKITFCRQTCQAVYQRMVMFTKENWIKNKFEFKKEMFTSWLYSNLTIHSKRISVGIPELVNFIKLFPDLIEVRQNHGWPAFDNYNIIEQLKDYNVNYRKTKWNNQTTVSPYMHGNAINKKINININSNFLILSPEHYISSYRKELQIIPHGNIAEISKIKRCKICNWILPGFFILNPDDRWNDIIPTFKEKVAEKFQIPLSKILRKFHFSEDSVITSLNGLYAKLGEINTELTKKYDEMIKTSEISNGLNSNNNGNNNGNNNNDNDNDNNNNNASSPEINLALSKKMSTQIDEMKVVLSIIDDIMTTATEKTEQEKFKDILDKMFIHLKKQFQHYFFIWKIKKILLEWEDVKKFFLSQLQSTNVDYIKCITALQSMNYSFNKTGETEINKYMLNNSIRGINLTHFTGNSNRGLIDGVKYFKYIDPDVSSFTETKFEPSLVALKDKGIVINANELLEKSRNLNENMIIIEIQKSEDWRYDLRIKDYKNTNIEALHFEYSDYRKLYFEGDSLRCAHIKGWGIINIRKFVKLWNEWVMEKTKSKDKMRDDRDGYDVI